jgi:hypothetical protein
LQKGDQYCGNSVYLCGLRIEGGWKNSITQEGQSTHSICNRQNPTRNCKFAIAEGLNPYGYIQLISLQKPIEEQTKILNQLEAQLAALPSYPYYSNVREYDEFEDFKLQSCNILAKLSLDALVDVEAKEKKMVIHFIVIFLCWIICLKKEDPNAMQIIEIEEQIANKKKFFQEKYQYSLDLIIRLLDPEHLKKCIIMFNNRGEVHPINTIVSNSFWGTIRVDGWKKVFGQDQSIESIEKR